MTPEGLPLRGSVCRSKGSTGSQLFPRHHAPWIMGRMRIFLEAAAAMLRTSGRGALDRD
jgi:hypothetical protein